MKKITRIPEAAAAQFPAIVARAIEDGLRCAPADRPKAEAALRSIYKLSGLSPDVPIIWVSSPLVGALAASIARSVQDARKAQDSAVRLAVGSAVYSAVDLAVYSAVYSAVDSAVGSAVGSAVYSAVGSLRWHDWRGGQFWISWPAFCEAIMACGVDDPSFAAVHAEHDLCRSAGYYWPNRHWIMVCERPVAIRRDETGRLHCETGPAVDYGETLRLYSWRGVNVPHRWIERRTSLDAKTALTWENVEQRRAACEIVGWHRILSELRAKTIDRHENPQIGELVEVNLPDSGKEKFLRVLCGTGREFALPVPRNMKTAVEAQAWTWGLNAKDFQTPEVRT